MGIIQTLVSKCGSEPQPIKRIIVLINGFYLQLMAVVMADKWVVRNTGEFLS